VISYQFNYAGFQSQIGQVENAELSMGFVLARGDWAKYNEFQIDTVGQTASVNIDLFVPVALLAETPKQVQQATGAPANGVDVTVVSMEGFSPGMDSKLTISTVPGARALIWLVLPNTGTRSTRPADRIKGADADGNITWEWNTHGDTAQGEGRIEIYVTTSTDSTFLAAFNRAGTSYDTDALNAIFPDKAEDIKKFKRGELEQLELDEHTTLKMFTVTYQ